MFKNSIKNLEPQHTLEYQINVGYEINVGLGILVKINKRRVWNKRSLVNFLEKSINVGPELFVLKQGVLELLD